MSCEKKTDCIRFLHAERPLLGWDKEKGLNHHIFPFHTKIQKNPFSPDASGECPSFIESPNSKRMVSGEF
jgi:hypothetical protein